jgi:uncharacterized membrane protein
LNHLLLLLLLLLCFVFISFISSQFSSSGAEQN